MRFYSELTYWNTACCKKCKNAFVSLSLRWKAAFGLLFVFMEGDASDVVKRKRERFLSVY